MNWPQTYGVKFLFWMDERYAQMRKFSLDSARVQTCLAHALESARALTFSGLLM